MGLLSRWLGQLACSISSDGYDVPQSTLLLGLALRVELRLHFVGDRRARAPRDEDHEAKTEAPLVFIVQTIQPCLQLGCALVVVIALLPKGECRDGARSGADAGVGVQQFDLLGFGHSQSDLIGNRQRVLAAFCGEARDK